jgi:hypothetical protein
MTDNQCICAMCKTCQEDIGDTNIECRSVQKRLVIQLKAHNEELRKLAAFNLETAQKMDGECRRLSAINKQMLDALEAFLENVNTCPDCNGTGRHFEEPGGRCRRCWGGQGAIRGLQPGRREPRRDPQDEGRHQGCEAMTMWFDPSTGRWRHTRRGSDMPNKALDELLTKRRQKQAKADREQEIRDDEREKVEQEMLAFIDTLNPCSSSTSFLENAIKFRTYRRAGGGA